MTHPDRCHCGGLYVGGICTWCGVAFNRAPPTRADLLAVYELLNGWAVPLTADAFWEKLLLFVTLFQRLSVVDPITSLECPLGCRRLPWVFFVGTSEPMVRLMNRTARELNAFPTWVRFETANTFEEIDEAL